MSTRAERLARVESPIVLANSPEWLEARRGGIGGSDAAAIVGLSPFIFPFELYQIKRGEAPEKEESEAQRLGHRLEAAICEEYAERKGFKIDPAPTMVQSKDYPFMFANCDGQIVKSHRPTPGGYEGKNLSGFTDLKEGLPDHIFIQVQHYMAVMRLEWFGVAILVGGTRLMDYEVERDQEVIDILIDAEKEFVRRVEIGDPPPMDGSERTSQLLRRMYPTGNGRTIILDDPEAAHWARQIDACKADAKDITKEQKAIQQRFIKTMGRNEVAIVPGYGKITYKETRFDDETVVDLDRLLIEQPEIYRQYVTTKPKKAQRRFLTRPITTTPEEDLQDDE